MEKITADTILDFLKTAVESKRMLNQEMWLDAAFKLNLLLGDEVHLAELARQKVAQVKLGLLKAQEKRNVAAVQLEVEASDDYRLAREQDEKVERIKEFIRIAKKNAEQGY